MIAPGGLASPMSRCNASPASFAFAEVFMPNRVIRDGLLDSDRYWSVSIEAQRMFWHMLLLADDYGCMSASATFLRRRCFNDPPSHEKVAKLLNELQDVDLVRLYEHDRACYAFIPRFRQRLQLRKLKHPRPPEAMYQDDAYAVNLFNKINENSQKSTVEQPLITVVQPSEVEVEVEVEKKRSKRLASSDKSLSPAGPAEPHVIKIPCIGGEFPIGASLVAEFEACYPAVDIMQTLREIRAWNISNPTNQKTRRGIMKHINSWMAREQNRG